MSKIGLFLGSTTGKTESAAEMIQSEFGGDEIVTIHNISEVNVGSCSSDFIQRIKWSFTV